MGFPIVSDLRGVNFKKSERETLIFSPTQHGQIMYLVLLL